MRKLIRDVWTYLPLVVVLLISLALMVAMFVTFISQTYGTKSTTTQCVPLVASGYIAARDLYFVVVETEQGRRTYYSADPLLDIDARQAKPSRLELTISGNDRRLTAFDFCAADKD